jgi:predicted nucleic acid-binding protein
MAYLLDTNILIYFFKNLSAVRLHMAQQQDTDIHLCTPVLWELLTGAHKSEHPATQLNKLAAVHQRFRVHAFDEGSARAGTAGMPRHAHRRHRHADRWHRLGPPAHAGHPQHPRIRAGGGSLGGKLVRTRQQLASSADHDNTAIPG